MGLAISFLYATLSLFYCFGQYGQRERSLIKLASIRACCWLLLVIGIELFAEPSTYQRLIQISFLLNTAGEFFIFFRRRKAIISATFYLMVIASFCRSAALWLLIYHDVTNGIELSIPAFIISICVLVWMIVYPNFTEGRDFLRAYTLVFFLQTWASLDLAIHHADWAHRLLLISTAGYLFSFCRYYAQAFIEKSFVKLHWVHFISNAIMAASTVLIAGVHM
ncbi:hypothetical protein [Vibrio sp. WXL210]|uniref:hypothetical protein n=1 Tax=Vibrio sp. WXL210 TaxID=3450709 RepID=UPI003EC4B1B8